MEISIKTSYASSYAVIKADNVLIEEEVSKTIYGVKDDGKTDYSKRLGKDIDDSKMVMFTEFIDTLYYYRESEFDSSDAIKQMFEKLPQNKKEELINSLTNEYL